MSSGNRFLGSGRATLFRAETRPDEIASGEEIRWKRTMVLQIWIDDFRGDANITFHVGETRNSWITRETINFRSELSSILLDCSPTQKKKVYIIARKRERENSKKFLPFRRLFPN